MTMAADCFSLRSVPTRPTKFVSRPRTARLEALTLMDVALRYLGAEGRDSMQALMLVRYAELKNVAPAKLAGWLAGLSASRSMALRYILEAVSVDCNGETEALTAEAYFASERQMKSVQQFDGDGNALWRLKLPRLNTVDALDDALSEQDVPALSA